MPALSYDAGDYCLLSTDPTQTNKVTNQETCNADPVQNPESSLRQVSGGARTEDILKCQLKPLDPAEYAPATLGCWTAGVVAGSFPAGRV